MSQTNPYEDDYASYITTTTTTTTTATGDVYYDNGTHQFNTFDGKQWVTVGQDTTPKIDWYSDEFQIPRFEEPDDDLEKAELKLAGKCTKCREDLTEHHWGCPDFDFGTSLGIGQTTASSISITSAFSSTLTLDGTKPFYGAGAGSSSSAIGGSTGTWTCNAFGLDNQVHIKVDDGKQPSWFKRKMQEVLLGNKWTKDEE